MAKIGTPKRTRDIVEQNGIYLSKKLGQNFLLEPAYIEKIVGAAGLTEKDLVLEIGPGIGALTESLLQQAGHVISVEYDSGLVKILQKIFADQNNFTLVHKDALKIDWLQTIKEKKGTNLFPGPYKVVANLPYYITTPLIMRFLEEDVPVDVMVFMIQKEVMERITAKAGNKNYGALTVAIRYYCDVEKLFNVPASVFFPKPDVDSAVIRLVKKQDPNVVVVNKAFFFKLVKAAFQQRRKTLLNALSSLEMIDKGKIKTVMAKIGMDPQRRGETLEIEEFARLANALWVEIES